MTAAGYHTRRLALAVVATQIDSHHDVYVGQFLAKTELIEQLQSATEGHGATFAEVILTAGRRLESTLIGTPPSAANASVDSAAR
jgi:hypothetical protein